MSFASNAGLSWESLYEPQVSYSLQSQHFSLNSHPEDDNEAYQGAVFVAMAHYGYNF